MKFDKNFFRLKFIEPLCADEHSHGLCLIYSDIQYGGKMIRLFSISEQIAYTLSKYIMIFWFIWKKIFFSDEENEAEKDGGMGKREITRYSISYC